MHLRLNSPTYNNASVTAKRDQNASTMNAPTCTQHHFQSCSRDPIGYAGSEWILYEYVSGKPLDSLDPSGEFVIVPFAIGCAIACGACAASVHYVNTTPGCGYTPKIVMGVSCTACASCIAVAGISVCVLSPALCAIIAATGGGVVVHGL